jgi:hypothetical protein
MPARIPRPVPPRESPTPTAQTFTGKRQSDAKQEVPRKSTDGGRACTGGGGAPLARPDKHSWRTCGSKQDVADAEQLRRQHEEQRVSHPRHGTNGVLQNTSRRRGGVGAPRVFSPAGAQQANGAGAPTTQVGSAVRSATHDEEGKHHVQHHQLHQQLKGEPGVLQSQHRRQELPNPGCRPSDGIRP